MNTYAIRGRFITKPLADDWQQQLAQKLGKRPRRSSAWTELALYGALNCLENAQTTLPSDAILLLSSQASTHIATEQAIQQLQHGLPMPFTFLQTQTALTLATLGQQLNWKGQALFLADTTPLALLQLATAFNKNHILLGWVNEEHTPNSTWLYLAAEQTNKSLSTLDVTALFSPHITHCNISNTLQAG